MIEILDNLDVVSRPRLDLATVEMGGIALGFAIHGRHLSHFAHLTSYQELLAVFGRPDRVHLGDFEGNAGL